MKDIFRLFDGNRQRMDPISGQTDTKMTEKWHFLGPCQNYSARFNSNCWSVSWKMRFLLIFGQTVTKMTEKWHPKNPYFENQLTDFNYFDLFKFKIIEIMKSNRNLWINLIGPTWSEANWEFPRSDLALRITGLICISFAYATLVSLFLLAPVPIFRRNWL